MNIGTQGAKEAGNMIDLDSNPTKLIEIVEIGKQLLATRECAYHIQYRERRGEILYDFASDVGGHVPADRAAEHYVPEIAAECYLKHPHLQCDNPDRADSSCA